MYCEIQGRENTCDGLTDRELLNHLYPGSGYSSEANGLMDNVRKLTVEQVRRYVVGPHAHTHTSAVPPTHTLAAAIHSPRACVAARRRERRYHREYYRPDNLCIIVTGQVAPAAILTALSSVEERILSKPKQPPRPRPWSQPVPPLLPASLPESVEVLFPSGDEVRRLSSLRLRGYPRSGVAHPYTCVGCAHTSCLPVCWPCACWLAWAVVERLRGCYRSACDVAVPHRFVGTSAGTPTALVGVWASRPSLCVWLRT